MTKCTQDHLIALGRCERVMKDSLPHLNDPKAIRALESDLRRIAELHDIIIQCLDEPLLPFLREHQVAAC